MKWLDRNRANSQYIHRYRKEDRKRETEGTVHKEIKESNNSQIDRQTERQSFNWWRENVKEKQCSSLFPSSFLALTSFTVFEEEGVSASHFFCLSVCQSVCQFVEISSLQICLGMTK